MIEQPAHKPRTPQSKGAYLVYGLLIGVLLVLAIRFVTYAGEHQTHYHANFAMYINGQREEFKGAKYYEEVAICGLHDRITPKARTHMHNEENGIIHVHDDGVTWGQFFENLGWYIGPDFVRTTDTTYTTDASNKLNIILNGQNLTGLTTITNELIDDKDRLLISYGSAQNAALDQQYKTVPSNAAEYNAKSDPAGCAGARQVTLSERFQNLF